MSKSLGSFALLYIKVSPLPNIITPNKKPLHPRILSHPHRHFQERKIMNITNRKFLKDWMKKWQKMGQRVIPCGASCDLCCTWCVWPLLHEEKEKIVPSDVPRGHLVVYVGEYHKRFVIKVTLLKHPLFQALLDQAQEVYDFTADSRLHIPCDENIFLSVVQCAKSPPDRRLSICL